MSEIMVFAGNNTSDRFGAALVNKIVEKCPQATFFGVGGALMRAAGVHLLYDISEQVSLGVFQSMKGSLVAKRLLKRVAEAMDKEQPALVIQIGLPLFGYKPLEIARAKDIPVLYYDTPFSRGLENIQTSTFSTVVNKVASISRFEAEQCQEAGIDSTFVGHPLLDLVDFSLTILDAREKLAIGSTKAKVVTILPGTREIDVKNALPASLKSLEIVLQKHSDLEIIIATIPTIRRTLVDEIVKKCATKEVRLEQDISCALRAADLAITSIGTGSLEASLLGVPSVAVYCVPPSTYFADKLLDRKPNVTITNNILRKTVIPEFIQGDFVPAKVAESIESLLYDEESRKAMLDKLLGLKDALGERGAIGRAANLVVEMVGCDDGTISS